MRQKESPCQDILLSPIYCFIRCLKFRATDRLNEVGRDLRWSLVQGAQSRGCFEVQSSPEKIQGWHLHKLSRQPDPLLLMQFWWLLRKKYIIFLRKAFAYLSIFPLLWCLSYILATKSQYILLQNLFLYIWSMAHFHLLSSVQTYMVSRLNFHSYSRILCNEVFQILPGHSCTYIPYVCEKTP